MAAITQAPMDFVEAIKNVTGLSDTRKAEITKVTKKNMGLYGKIMNIGLQKIAKQIQVIFSKYQMNWPLKIFVNDFPQIL